VSLVMSFSLTTSMVPLSIGTTHHASALSQQQLQAQQTLSHAQYRAGVRAVLMFRVAPRTLDEIRCTFATAPPDVCSPNNNCRLLHQDQH
jgi:hypothetical protein